MELRQYIIMGKVQGVGYRYFTKEAARGLSLRGWVKNMLGGNVECLICGETESLEIFEKKIRKGPPLSRVVNMEKKVIPSGEIDIPEKFEIIQ